NRAFDVSGRNRLVIAGVPTNVANIYLNAMGNIDLSRSGATANYNPVVDASSPTIGDKGGRNTLRSYSGKVQVNVNAMISAAVPVGAGSVQGTNTITTCTGLVNNGTITPAPSVATSCSPISPAQLYADCSQLGGMSKDIAVSSEVNTSGALFFPNPTNGMGTVKFTSL